MSNRYGSPAAFRQALEFRLREEAARRNVPLNDLRQKLVMERLLARLFAEPGAPWLLKGGYAMDLRYRPHARTTRDLDLSAKPTTMQGRADLAVLRENLLEACEGEGGDYVVFQIGTARGELPGPPLGGARFPVVAQLAGREYARFHLDTGLGDAIVGEPEALVGDSFLAFAGLDPVRVLAIPKAQQFAEKIHAYTRPWADRTNTRVKDLVDLVVLIERGSLAPDHVREAVQATFQTRLTHAPPSHLPQPPSSWGGEFAALAQEAGLAIRDPDQALAAVNKFWIEHRIQR